MENKKYSSYKEIDLDLEILKTEREIHYQKIVLNIEKTKDSLMPSNLTTLVGNSILKSVSGSLGIIVKTLIPIAINWYLNKKRGD
jgi:Family of unknown function (DUF6327)